MPKPILVNPIDDQPLTFGKHAGKTPMAVAEIDAAYVVWLYDTVKPPKCSKGLRDHCREALRALEEDTEEFFASDDRSPLHF